MAHIFSALDIGARPEGTLDEKIVGAYRAIVTDSITVVSDRYHLYDVSEEATLVMDKDDVTHNKQLFVNLLECCWYDTTVLYDTKGDKQGVVQVYFRYMDMMRRRIYVMGGYFFDIASHNHDVPKIPFADFASFPSVAIADRTAIMSVPAPRFTIPVFVLPCREHTAKMDMKIMRVTNIIKSLFVLLSGSDELPHVCPTGDSMYSFETATLGHVSGEEEELAINVYIGSICHSVHAVNIAATSFSDLVMRCCDTDPTFFARLIAHNPSYRECTAPAHVRDKVKTVIVAKAKDYTAVKMPCAIARFGHVLKSVID